MEDSFFAPQLQSQPIEYYFYPNSSVPVFCPTMEQFEDFEGLITAIEPLALRGGVCKIIPPRAWRDRLEPAQWRELSETGFPTMKPLQQYFNGTGGIYHQYNVDFHRKLRLAQFFQMSQERDYRTPDIKTDEPEETVSKRTEEEENKKGEQENDASVEGDVVYESENVGIAVDYATGEVRLTEAAAEQLRSGIRSDAGRAKYQPATAAYRVSPDTEGDPAADHNGGQPARVFTADGRALFVSAREHLENEELERVYWKNLTFNRPLYGADVLGTLFPEEREFPHWNIRNLPGLLRKMNQRVPGVNDPYLYLGMWKATFAWHVEDMDLYSINYIHFGAPKAWFAVPIEARGRFEGAMQNVFASDHKQCSQFLRHKAFLLSPRFLASQGIPYNKVVQRAGEIVLTFPMGYHAGFNHGFNCAESVNFALPRWLDLARTAKHCKCIKDSVTIDVREWFEDDVDDLRLIDRIKEIGATAQDKQRQKEPGASPPAPAAAATTAASPERKRRKGRPRKSEGKRKPTDNLESSGSPSKKRAKEPAAVVEHVDVTRRLASLHTPVGVCGGCLQTISADSPLVECQQCGLTVHPSCSALSVDDGNYKCANCVMDSDEVSCSLCAYQNGLLLPVRGNDSRKFAHFLCANFISETFFELPAPPPGERVATRSRSTTLAKHSAQVCGVDEIAKAKWVLKCELCEERGLAAFGPTVQCAYPRCVRAFHPMCAAVCDLDLLEWDSCKIFCRSHKQ